MTTQELPESWTLTTEHEFSRFITSTSERNLKISCEKSRAGEVEVECEYTWGHTGQKSSLYHTVPHRVLAFILEQAGWVCTPPK